MKHRGQSRRFKPTAGSVLLAVVTTLMIANLLAAGLPFKSTNALMSDAGAVGANTFTTSADWTPPATNPAKLLNDIGHTGYLRQGSTYQVCSQTTDDGNPPAGVDTVTANLAVAANVITTGATAVSLISGSYTCGAESFNYQSGIQTADASVPEGSREFHLTAADNAANQNTTSWSVTIDNTRPTPTAFATTDNVGTPGRMETGDVFTLTLSEDNVDLNRILSGWDGSATSVVIKAHNNEPDFGGNDGVTICKGLAINKCDANGQGQDNIFGRIDLGADDYVTGDSRLDATLAWDPGTRTFTVTLGACTHLCSKITTGSSSTASLIPQDGASDGGIRDKAGNNTTSGDTSTETGLHF